MTTPGLYAVLRLFSSAFSDGYELIGGVGGVEISHKPPWGEYEDGWGAAVPLCI